MQIYCRNLLTNQETKVSPKRQCAMEDSPVWLGDGSGFYFISDREREFKRVLFWDRETGRTEEVYEVNWDVTHIAVSGKDRYLAVVVNEDGDSGIHILETETGKEIEIPRIPRGTIGDEEPVTWSEEGYRLLFSFESGSRIQNIWLLDIEKGILEQVTENEHMTVRQEDLTEPVLCRYKSFDGLEIPYCSISPRGYPPGICRWLSISTEDRNLRSDASTRRPSSTWSAKALQWQPPMCGEAQDTARPIRILTIRKSVWTQ